MTAPPREAIVEAPAEANNSPLVEFPPEAEAKAPAKRRSRGGKQYAGGEGRQRRGKHFGPRPVADPLDAWIPPTRCTKAQRERAEADAAQAGITLNGLVRLRLFQTAGPRAHRNPSKLDVAITQLAGQMGKPGGLLNQGIRAVNRIALEAPEGNTRDRLAELMDEALDLLRPAVAEHRETLAAAYAHVRLRQDDGEGAF